MKKLTSDEEDEIFGYFAERGKTFFFERIYKLIQSSLILFILINIPVDIKR